MILETTYLISAYSMPEEGIRAYLEDVVCRHSSLATVTIVGRDEDGHAVYEVWNGTVPKSLIDSSEFTVLTDWDHDAYTHQEDYVSMRGGVIYVNGTISEDQDPARHGFLAVA